MDIMEFMTATLMGKSSQEFYQECVHKFVHEFLCLYLSIKYDIRVVYDTVIGTTGYRGAFMAWVLAFTKSIAVNGDILSVVDHGQEDSGFVADLLHHVRDMCEEELLDVPIVYRKIVSEYMGGDRELFKSPELLSEKLYNSLIEDKLI